MKVVQALSLACSIATLLVLYRLIYRERLIESPRARLYSLLVVCFLPQFVMFSLYISNDAPIFLLGAMAILQTYLYISAPGWKQLSLLSLVTGLGLLTKATFLAFVPPLLALIVLVGWRERQAWQATLIRGMLFLGITLALGSYGGRST
jgi:4-amino-4-deoxy-L-arabinose transferase-like glycosyltransferase